MKSHFLRTAISQSYSYINTYSDNLNLSSYTFFNSAIGPADNSRLVVVVLAGTGPNSQGGVLPTLTIGGVSATRQVGVLEPVTEGNAAALFTLPISSGTTSNIVATFGAVVNRAAISIYSLYNLHNNSNPISAGGDAGDEVSSSITLDQRYGGIVLYTSQVFNNLTPPALPTYTWSTSLGDTVTYDDISRVGGEVFVQPTGSFRPRYTGSNTISLTYDGGITRNHVTVAASFY